jgi:hypothetical protein
LQEVSASNTRPVSLLLDLRITHERWGSSSDPSLNGHLHYPEDVDRTLNEETTGPRVSHGMVMV